MDDLRTRLANKAQLTTDGHKAYLEAVEGAFGADVAITAPGRYSPPECIGEILNLNSP